MNIRVVGVAPGVVRTPIWTKDKLDWVDESVDKWIQPSEVAVAMLDCVQKGEYVGGTIVELGLGRRRNVEELNDPGPGGEGQTVAKVAKAFADTFGEIEKNFGR